MNITKFLYIIISFFILIGNSALSAKNNNIRQTQIIIDALHEKSKNVSPLFFGINSLYWIDDDKSRSHPELTSALKALNISTIRYPGGEVADNFNWKSNTLNDKYSYPYSKNIDDPQTRMDFDEFVEWKDRIGAEATIVINLENGFIEKDLKKAANLAAEWVKYANIEKKYGIKYWEIGNESYHLGTRYALTAQEYANALKLFSGKMKAVDPSIKIGAIGPFDVSKTPIVGLLSQSEIRDLRSRKTSKERKKFKKKYRRTFIKDPNIASWWETVVQVAKNDFDFAVVHRYTGRRKFNSDIAKPLILKRELDRLSYFLKSSYSKHIPISVTEYNIAGRSSLNGIYFSLTLAEMLGNYLESGVFMTNYWPVRTKNRRSMLGMRDFKKKPAYHSFKAFSTHIGNKILDTRSLGNDMIYSICTLDTDDNTVALFLVNRSTHKYNSNIKLPYTHVKPTEAMSINSKHLDLQMMRELPKFNSEEKSWRMDLSPLSLTIIKFKVK